MNGLVLAVLMATAPTQTQLAADGPCGHAEKQHQELRVTPSDQGYVLELDHINKWRQLITAQGEIAMPRLAMTRAEVAFLIDVEGTWTLQVLRLNGASAQLGELSRKPSNLCYDQDEMRLLLVSGSGAVTHLALPDY